MTYNQLQTIRIWNISTHT